MRAGLLALAVLATAAPAAAQPPAVDYMLQCQGCHLADGRGMPADVPDFRGQVGRFLAVPGGRDYLVRVPGSALSPLDDARLAAVLNWIVARFDPEHARGQPAFDAAEVARARRRPLVEVEAERARLLALSPGAGSPGVDAPAR